MSLYEQRDRAGSFGEDAEAYDRTRPSYPAELVDELLRDRPVEVLDVGCGTGKAGRLLVERRCHVLGVEPDARMAAVARRHGLDVEVAPFETWDDAGRRFDLLICGQAWHWIDPDVGARRAAELLRPGGRLAVFWNLGAHDDAMQRALDPVYAEHLPEDRHAGALGRVAGDLRPLAGIDETAAFEPQAFFVHEWTTTHTRDEWLDQLATHSNHRVLPDERRSALLDAVGATIDRHGGTIALHYQTLLISAVRRAAPPS